MTRKFIKILVIIVATYITFCLITPFNKILRNRSIENQISYLSQILDNGYDDKLQNRFPEGKLFSNAIFALSIIEFCESQNIAKENYARIVDSCIERIQSNKTLSTFDPNIDPTYGIFYNGWTNYTYNKYQNSQLFTFSSIKEKVEAQSKIIEQRLVSTQLDSFRILDTYIDANWPADNLIGIISIDNDSVKHRWLNVIFSSSKNKSGLIHHSGNDPTVIRGSSSALIIYCLAELGYENVQQYNEQFKITFIDEFLNIQLVKENEDGTNHEDWDSGPVLLGYGASATIMNIKTQANLNSKKANYTWAIMNLISMPINLFGKKYYLFKKEPMFDLFMLWGSVELD